MKDFYNDSGDLEHSNMEVKTGVGEYDDKALEDLTSFPLYDSAGNVILEKNVSATVSQRPESHLDLSRLDQGKYLLQVRQGDDYYNKDIII